MGKAGRDRHLWRARATSACVAVLAAGGAGAGTPAARAQIEPAQPSSVPGQVLVQFDPDTGAAERADVRAAAGTRAERALRRPGLQLLQVQGGTSVARAIRRLQASRRVRFAQPNLVYRAAANDPDLPAQWNLAAIGTAQAWQTTQGSPAVTVAVVDSGIAFDHPDLAANVDVARSRDLVDDELLDNPTDPSRDDGFDPVNDPSDLNGHGTHVAGTIAAAANNGIGIAGIAPNSRLVSVRVLDGHGTGESDDIADGLDYAGAIGAKVANVSISAPGVDPAVASAIRAHPGTLYVVAAGNGPSDNDRAPQSPCNVDAPNLVCVAATTQGDRLASFSDYGRTSVDLGAPGQGILSTVPARTYLKHWSFDTSSALDDWNTNFGWALTSAYSSSPANSVTDSAAPGPYASNQDTSLITNATLDFRNRRGCAVDYQLRLDTRPGDLMRVMTDPHPDRFGPLYFFTQDSWVGTTNGVFVPRRTYLDSDGQQAHLRLNLRANGDADVADGAYVDDVAVSCFSSPDTGAYETLDGTSMATPHVAGVAALIWAARPGASVASVRCDLLGSGAALSDLAGTTVTGRRLDAAAALSGAQSSIAPATTLGADGVSPSAATLHATAYPCGTDSSYQFELGTTSAYGAVLPAAPAAIGAGTGLVDAAQSVGGLAPATTYHFRLVTIRAGERLPGADQTFTTASTVSGASARPLTLRDVKVSCKRSGRGRHRSVTCTLRRATAVRRLTARLTMRGRVYARASGKPPRNGRVKLKPVRRLVRGHYRVTFTLRDAKGKKRTARLKLRV